MSEQDSRSTLVMQGSKARFAVLLDIDTARAVKQEAETECRSVTRQFEYIVRRYFEFKNDQAA